MGLSVSAATAIVVAGLFISMSILYPAVSNGFERVNDARDASAERLLDRQNTAIDVASAEYNASSGTLVVNVTNEGTTALAVSETDLVVDNDYVEYTASVAGDEETDLWLPGETMKIEVALETSPERVKISTTYGVSDSADVGGS